MSTVTVPMDDAALFGAATSEEPATEVTTEAPAAMTATPEPEAPGQPRDESGRFAAKVTEAPQAETTQAPESAAGFPQPVKEETIPSWRLREEAENRRAVEQQNAMLMRQLGELQAQVRQNQPPEKRPDFFENPDAATEHHVRGLVDPQMQAMRQQLMHMGQMLATQAHGAEAVKAADDAFTRAVEQRTLHPADYQRVMGAANIYDAAVQWHKAQTALATVGNDPNAWFEKQLAERMKDPAFQAKQLETLRGNVQQSGNGQRPIVQVPPSLSRATSSAPNTPDNPGDLSDTSLFRHAMAR